MTARGAPTRREAKRDPTAEPPAATLERCKKILGVDAGFVALRSAREAAFEITFLDAGPFEIDAANGLPAPFDRLGANATETRRPVFSNTLSKRTAKPPSAADRLVPPNAIVAPIVVADEVVGLVGLVGRPRRFTRAVPTTGPVVRSKARGFTGRRPAAVVETALYRVAQEAMTDVLRPADASRVDVLLQKTGSRVRLVIEDDGVGFDPNLLRGDDHIGLIGMRERAETLGGSLTIESSPGQGTRIIVEVASADPHLDR